MNQINIVSDRRTFLKGAAAVSAGLVIGLRLAVPAARAQTEGAIAEALANVQPNAFIRIAPDNIVTVLSKHIEFGQGPYTGLATIAAEELDADWSLVRAESAPANLELYANLALGAQLTGGSSAIANSWDQMRLAGALARAMLIQAAAAEWGVPAGEITTAKSRLMHKASGKDAPYGEFAPAAAALPVPDDVPLKDPKDFILIGTDVPKLDSRAKTTGKAMFTIDRYRDGMLTVLVARPPLFGGKVASFDDKAARAIEGVVDVKQIPQGIAVYAEGYWPAKKGRDALVIEWDEAGAENRSTGQLIDYYRKLAAAPGVTAAGDPTKTAAGLAAAAKTVEATYVFPYLAHAAMETLDCALVWTDDGVQSWFGSQAQTLDQMGMAKVLGLDPAQVKIETLFAGGSFGRRAQPDAGVAVEAAEAVKAIGKNRPIKLIYTREDDMQAGRYRPLFVHRMKAGLDGSGAITGWEHVLVGQSIMGSGPFASRVTGGIDPTSVEGAFDPPYKIGNPHVSLHTTDAGVTVLWWRSVGHTHTGFAVETFMERVLKAAGKDSVEGRLELMRGVNPRLAGTLEAVAKAADWGGPVPEGRARGVASVESFNSYVSQVAEVSIGSDGKPKVHKVWVAVDCGIAVTPNIIRAQMEGGVGYGLGAILHDEITLDGGRVVQTNFDTYRSLRIDEMPEVEVTIIKSNEKPTGVGEPGVPPIGPAVANAWAALTGQWVTELPFRSAAGV